MTRALLLFVLLVPIATAEEKKDLVAEEKAKLEGLWIIASIGGGVPNPEKGVPVFEFSGDKIRTFRIVKKGDKVEKAKDAEAEYSYKLDPSQSPKHIDLTHLTGPGKDKTQKGIYALKGDELRLHVFFVPPDTERPADFSKTATFTLERVKIPDAGKK